MNWIRLDQQLLQWLSEDIGHGDQTTLGLQDLSQRQGQGTWVAKASGVVCGLLVARRVFHLLASHTPADASVWFTPLVEEGTFVEAGTQIAELGGTLSVLLTGERVALNIAMRLSGIATAAHRYAALIADLPAQLVDTRKTTPGLRSLEKYAARTGGAHNHRMGLDDSIMIKDNHIAAAGGIGPAIDQIRKRVPYPLSIEIETETLEQVKTALGYQVDIIMLDNMDLKDLKQAVELIRSTDGRVKIEASGNVSTDSIRDIALTGVDYISSSGTITRSAWLDLSMRLQASG